MIKTLNKVHTEGTYLNIIKAVYDKTTVVITLNGKKLKAFLLRSGTRQGCPLSPLLLNIVVEILAIAIRQEKEIKVIQVRKEEVKLTLFADGIIICVENPTDTTKALLGLTKTVTFQDTKSIYRNLLFLYTNTKLSERDIKKTIPFSVASIKIKPRINLTKETKDLQTENYKTLMDEIENDKNKWEDILCSWIERILLKCPYYLKKSTDQMISLSKFQWHLSQNYNEEL